MWCLPIEIAESKKGQPKYRNYSMIGQGFIKQKIEQKTMQNHTFTFLLILAISVSMSSCGSGFYQAHYPNKLKQGKLRKLESKTTGTGQCEINNTISPFHGNSNISVLEMDTMEMQVSQPIIQEDSTISDQGIAETTDSRSTQSMCVMLAEKHPEVTKNSNENELAIVSLPKTEKNRFVQKKSKTLRNFGIMLMYYALGLVMILSIILLLNDLIIWAWLVFLLVLLGLYFLFVQSIRNYKMADSTRYPELNRALGVFNMMVIILLAILSIGFMIYLTADA